MLFSCAPARYIPEGEHLLSKNKVESTRKVIPENQLKSYIVQRPNKKLVGLRFYLFLYNLANPEKEKWPHNWLRKIGEEPVIYTQELTGTSVDRISQFLENKGYYQAEVYDSVKYRGKNAKVTYIVDPNHPYTVRTVEYMIEDTGLASLIYADTINSLLVKGMVFDKDVLQNERIRLENLLKEQGYFRFSKEYIYFRAYLSGNLVDLTMGVEEYVEGTPDPVSNIKYHPKFKIGNVFVFPNLNVPDNRGLPSQDQPSDTIQYNGQYFISSGNLRLKPAVVTNASFIIPGEYYRLSNENKTYRNLSELGLIRYTNISFLERDSAPASADHHLLDCRIELTQKRVQSYQIEPVGTITSGDLGVRGNLLYQNLNVFRGSEILNFRLTGAIEALKNRTNNKFSSMQEIGVVANIVFPKFLAPFRLEGFVRRYSPRTSISASYSYQSRPDYTRSIVNSSFSYQWNANQYVSHTVWPFEINYVQIYENRSSQEFIDSMQNTLIGYSFEDHLVNTVRYGFELNNQLIGQSKNFMYLRFNMESAGNLVNVWQTTISRNPEQYPLQVFNVPYFQYLRGDIDVRYYQVINTINRIVYRAYIGLGYPYGNSGALPYEKKFYSGGPNSIRAWSTRDLGPGSYAGSDTITDGFLYPNKTGDVKIEANLEYRFELFWKMEGALFIDVGNIWAIRKEEDLPDARFQWNRFYKEIAVGSGFGIRFDFSFFLLRFDFGLKLHDPALPEHERWIPVLKDFSLNDLHLKFGIGYPF
ncbi:MAG: BamA/TamA family outer membrane protein [Bacteroidales bacterium]|nr:BamA/TamA family outer membrane protein [Bacteroidales bacterium]